MIEHRRFPRIPVSFLANFSPKALILEDKSIFPVSEISFKGLFLVGEPKFSKYQILDILLEIPNIGEFPMRVQVIHQKFQENPGMGIEILEVEADFRKNWAKFIKGLMLLWEAKEDYLKKKHTHNENP